MIGIGTCVWLPVSRASPRSFRINRRANVGAKFRFGLRERIWATVVGAIAIVVVGLTLAFNLVIADRLDHEANSVAVARATAELDALRVTSNGVRLSETFDVGAVDTPTWVFDHARAIEQPRSSRANARAAASRAGAPRGFHDVAATDTRLYALPVVSDGQRVGTVVSAVALGPYERIKRVALIGSIGSPTPNLRRGQDDRMIDLSKSGRVEDRASVVS